LGIKLDWEIEADQAHVKTAGEDPEAARRRRRARTRVLMLVAAVLLIVGGIAGAVVYRLRQVDAQIEQRLRDTVDSEVAALRIGDTNTFMTIQRSASQDWMDAQKALFDNYQTLKVGHDLRLTGQILDLDVDGQRGRVRVVEIVDGVPYTRVWFYWRYDDGWRHVPPDFTYWGNAETYTGETVTVHYHAMDEALVQAIGPQLDSWLKTGCAALACNNLPQLNVEIVADPALQLGWSQTDPWLLQMPSPYTGQARMDTPFNVDLQIQTANLIADRLVTVVSNNMQPVFPADADYLRKAVVSWLVGRFTQVQTNVFLISSLAQVYGDQAVGRLLQVVQPDSNIAVLNQISGTATLDQMNLDWRDFLGWRLALEDQLISRRDDANFQALYDNGDAAVRNVATSRFNSALPAEPQSVVSVASETDASGRPQLHALVEVGSAGATRQEDVIFRLVDGVWRRAS
jgi:hypothetical protein